MINYIRKKLRLSRWKRKGCSVPPPHVVKEECVLSHAKRYGLRILVETGTFHGEMIETALGHFDIIYSIELDDALYAAAVKKFAGRKEVRLLHGDSGQMIGKVLAELKAPALFWLDAHYMDGRPAFIELEHITGHAIKNHVIIVDDIPLYFGNGSELKKVILGINPDYKFTFETFPPRASEHKDYHLVAHF